MITRDEVAAARLSRDPGGLNLISELCSRVSIRQEAGATKRCPRSGAHHRDHCPLRARFAQASISCLNHNLGCRGPRSITGRGMSG